MHHHLLLSSPENARLRLGRLAALAHIDSGPTREAAIEDLLEHEAQ